MRRISTAALAAAIAASSAAAVGGWLREAPAAESPSIAIIDVRPLVTQDAGLEDLITHTFAVRVAIDGFELMPYRPGTTAADNRARSGHWRLYLDGRSLADNLGGDTVTYTPYLTPGTHWIAAELSNADSTSLHPSVWSEPVVLHVPKVIRCWQSGWRGSPRRSTPQFTCTPASGARKPAF